MKDFLGREISPGDTLVYPVRRGSVMVLKSARVYAVSDRVLAYTRAVRGTTEYEMSVELEHPTRCVVTG